MTQALGLAAVGRYAMILAFSVDNDSVASNSMTHRIIEALQFSQIWALSLMQVLMTSLKMHFQASWYWIYAVLELKLAGTI